MDHFVMKLLLALYSFQAASSVNQSGSIAPPTSNMDLKTSSVTSLPPIPTTSFKPPAINLPPLPPLPPLPSLPTGLTTGLLVSTSSPTTTPPISTPKPTPVNIIKKWLNMSQLHDNLKKVIRKTDIKVFSCGRDRCGKQERRLSSLNNGPKCFCDVNCLAYGDCCYDYKQSCQNERTSTDDHEKSSCMYRVSYSFYGVTVIDTCLSRNPSGNCKTNQSDVLTLQPVLDLTSNRTYRNGFCASCNGKKNVTLWSVMAACENSLPCYRNKTGPELVEFVNKSNCSLDFYPSRNIELRHRMCIPRLHDKQYEPINDTHDEDELKKLCMSYAFPMCAVTPEGDFHWFKNPHCILYQGMKTFEETYVKCPGYNPSLPPLTIFFDFQTTSYSVSGQGQNDRSPSKPITRQVKCPANQGYDVFVGRCRQFYRKRVTQGIHEKNFTNSSTNCTFIKLLNIEYQIFDNKSLLYANTIFPQNKYYQINDTLFICINMSSNFTVGFSADKNNPQSLVENVLSGLTIGGYVLSMIGLLVLITTYFILSELRNLPGKIIMSLSVTMLTYIILYFFVNQSDHRFVCHVIGICLHFTLLSMFSWMNVMAFDIHWTFTRKGKSNGRSSGFFSGVYLRYALYAWLVPLFITVVSVSLDVTHVFSMGYATGPYCFMENPYAKVYTLAVPVGLILLYNIIALCHTLFNIRNVQKHTTKVTNQKHQVDLPIVCLKMTSVMGVTWIIGFVAGLTPFSFLRYLHVILNSLQGWLIFVSYVLNRRVLRMYRSYFSTLRGSANSVTSKRSTDISPTV